MQTNHSFRWATVLRREQDPTSYQYLLLSVGLWVMTVGNWALWSSLSDLTTLPTMLGLGLVMWLLWWSLLQLLAWPVVLKFVLALLLVVSASTTHFMLTYGAVIDPTMMANTMNTDAHEVGDLLSARLLLTQLLVAGPGLLLVWWWRVRWPTSWRGLLQRVGVALGALAMAVVVLWFVYADMASLMRNHHSVRYQINPFNAVYGWVRTTIQDPLVTAKAMTSVGEDAQLRAPANQAPTLLLLVVGETVRAANFGLSGYARETTPNLRRWQAQGQLVYWSNAQSCGTNTQVSVPCMFSPLTRSEGGDEPAQVENLLDVLQHAGLAVLWLDNQSGCKGVCDRVPHASTKDTQDPLCSAGECLDELMVRQLDQRLSELDPVKRARGVVLVLHEMGSHGPAYSKRTSATHQPFLPACHNTTLPDCSPEALRNAYDNSIVYTDHVLNQALLWLQDRERDGKNATGLVYASDHGESLGESGLYLHGTPRAFAPDEQTHVPMLAWYSKALTQKLGLDMACLLQKNQKPVSHDHLFHSVLGLMQVSTGTYQAGWDWNDACVS